MEVSRNRSYLALEAAEEVWNKLIRNLPPFDESNDILFNVYALLPGQVRFVSLAKRFNGSCQKS